MELDSVPSLAQEALKQHFVQVYSSCFSGMSTYTQKKTKKICRVSERNREELKKDTL